MDKRSGKKARDERKGQSSSRRKKEDRYGDIRPEHDMWGKVPKRLRSHYLLVFPQAHAEPEHSETLEPETETASAVPEHAAPTAAASSPDAAGTLPLRAETASAVPEHAAPNVAASSPEAAGTLPLREWTKADLLRHKLKQSV